MYICKYSNYCCYGPAFFLLCFPVVSVFSFYFLPLLVSSTCRLMSLEKHSCPASAISLPIESFLRLLLHAVWFLLVRCDWPSLFSCLPLRFPYLVMPRTTYFFCLWPQTRFSVSWLFLHFVVPLPLAVRYRQYPPQSPGLTPPHQLCLAISPFTLSLPPSVLHPPTPLSNLPYHAPPPTFFSPILSVQIKQAS